MEGRVLTPIIDTVPAGRRDFDFLVQAGLEALCYPSNVSSARLAWCEDEHAGAKHSNALVECGCGLMASHTATGQLEKQAVGTTGDRVLEGQPL